MQHGQIALRRLALALLLAFVAGVRVVAAETLSIQWDPNPEPEVVGYRVYIGSQPGIYDSQVDVGDVTTYNLGVVQAGRRYCFAVAAFFAGPTLGSKSVEVCTDADDVNQPPVLKSPGNQSSAVGAAVTLTLAGSDPEGLPITYSAKGLPAGLTLNPNTGFISGTLTTVATSSVTVTVSDSVLTASQAFSWAVSASAPNAATPLRPSGTITTQTPTFEWESVATATAYRLWVDDASATDPKIQLDLTPAQAGCTTAGAVCHVSPGVMLQVGKGSWSVRTSNASGVGPWSGALDFTVADGKLPVLTITAPANGGTIATTASSIALVGTALDDTGVSQVTWTNSLGGSGTAIGTSAWAVLAVPIKVGSNVITLTARDLSGNTVTKTLTVTKSDGQPPVLTILSPSPAAAYSTTVTTLAMSGSASDDGTVAQVSWVSDRGGSGVASGTTAWSIPAILLKAGTNVIAVTAQDNAGYKTTKTFTATLTDADAPVVTITTPTTASAFSTGNESVTLGGTASDASGVTQVTWVNDKGSNGTASGSNAWTIPAVALKPGANVITVTARDAAGNVGTDSITISVTDGAAPVVAITSPNSAAVTTAGTSIALGGTAGDAFGVTQVTWANSTGGSGTAAGTTSWSVASVPLAMGVNVITITAKDAAGHAGTGALTVTRADGVAPTIVINTPAANTVTTGELVNLSGAARDDLGVAEVTWTNNRGGGGRATGTTSWSIANAVLQGGVNIFTVVAQDASGNKTSASVSVTRDAQAPTVSIVTPAPATFVTNKAAVALAGKAGDDLGVKQVTWQNNRGGSGTATGTTDWSVPTVALQAGPNSITITARDGSGNVGTATLTVILDTRAPVISLATPTTGSSFTTTEASIALGGVANDDSALAEVTWTSSAGTAGVASGTSTWSTPRIAFNAGVNTVTVTARDKAGNSASATLSVTVKDAKAPGVRILVPTAESSFVTASSSINLGGEAVDDVALARIAWVNDRGGSGLVNLDNRWVSGAVTLQLGVNVITVTATDASGNVATDVIRVTYELGMPNIALTSPTQLSTYTTSSPNVALTGVASDNGGSITRVKWSTDKGQSGDAVGTTSWSIPLVTVPMGTTVVTVTAYDNSGNMANVALTVTYGDTSKPAVKIYTPTTGSTMSLLNDRVTIAGTALDNVGVTQVTWSTDRGASGTAFGTGSWSTPSLALVPGTTIVTITARDSAGNVGTARLSITSLVAR